MSLNEQLDFDHESCDLASANTAAATVLRQLATQLEHAGYQARQVRRTSSDSRERARCLNFALVNLASVMSEIEVIGLVNALRHAANTTQEDHVCEFCGTPTQPWSMLTSITRDEEDECNSLTHHSWDQYGYTLCKNCHFAIRQARFQTASQM